MRLTEEKQAAKDTTTRAIYNECLQMLAATPPSKWDKRDDSNDEDENMKPIRNIFKMSRELVTKDDKKKTKAQLADLEGMEFDGAPAGKSTEVEGE